MVASLFAKLHVKMFLRFPPGLGPATWRKKNPEAYLFIVWMFADF